MLRKQKRKNKEEKMKNLGYKIGLGLSLATVAVLGICNYNSRQEIKFKDEENRFLLGVKKEYEKIIDYYAEKYNDLVGKVKVAEPSILNRHSKATRGLDEELQKAGLLH